ncbi:MAG TPA: aspartate kinase [Bacillota bacterium]|nr:aspartate kinase [Bacillota bacterium]
MQILVQKYGGTSVGDQKSRQHVIRHIKQALSENFKVIVVVSALGRNPEPYATDSLLNLVSKRATQTLKRETDMLMSCGEIISSVVLTSELTDENIEATALTGPQAGILTDESFGDATIKKVNPKRIFDTFNHVDVIIVAGFQGQTSSGDLTTLGRGGSDTTAASLAAATKAKRVDIFTDVNGIMTADPRMVENARCLDVVTYMEICHLAYQGAKVVHPRAVEIAMHAEVPLRVRSTYTDDLGTLITSLRQPTGQRIPDRLVTGVTHIDDISQVVVQANTDDQTIQANVFRAMAEANISVDFINISQNDIAYTVSNEHVEQTERILDTLAYNYDIQQHFAKVSVVGAGMTGVPGVASRIVQALTKENIQIYQAADSHTTIWVLIRDTDLPKALNALHEAFELNISPKMI